MREINPQTIDEFQVFLQDKITNGKMITGNFTDESYTYPGCVGCCSFGWAGDFFFDRPISGGMKVQDYLLSNLIECGNIVALNDNERFNEAANLLTKSLHCAYLISICNE